MFFIGYSYNYRTKKMVYKKYIKKKGKTFGPYYYESYRDKDGKVKTRYLGETLPKKYTKEKTKKHNKKSKVTTKKTKWLYLLPALVFILLIAISVPKLIDLTKTPETSGLGELASLTPGEETQLPAQKEVVQPSTNQEIQETSEDRHSSPPSLSYPENTETKSKSVEIKTQRYTAVINRPVKWAKSIKIKDQSELKDISLTIPKDSLSINLKSGKEAQETIEDINTYNQELTTKDKKELKQGETTLPSTKENTLILKAANWIKDRVRITGNALEEWEIQEGIRETEKEKIIQLDEIIELEEEIEESIKETGEAEIVLEYYTPGPQSYEEKTPQGKKIKITSEEEGYTDVLAYTEIPNSVQIKEKEKIKLINTKTGEETEFETYDTDEDNYIDYIEWTVPHLSEQTYEIIYITKASELDSSRNLLRDVYDYVFEQDNNWIQVTNNNYIRVSFEKNLTNENDITIYARGNGKVEIYEKDKENLIAEFPEINQEKEYKIYLTKLQEEQETFDLKITGEIEIDYIVDPTYIYNPTDFKAYHITRTDIIPTNPTDSRTEFTSTTYLQIRSSDNNRAVTSYADNYGEYDSQLFEFDVSNVYDESNIVSINLAWEGYGETQPGFLTTAYVWDGSSWSQLWFHDFTSSTDVSFYSSLSSSDIHSDRIYVLVSTEKYLPPCKCDGNVNCPDTNWGDDLYRCEGRGRRCSSGICVYACAAITDRTYTGNLGGVDGGHAICESEFGEGWKFAESSTLNNCPTEEKACYGTTWGIYWLEEPASDDNCYNFTSDLGLYHMNLRSCGGSSWSIERCWMDFPLWCEPPSTSSPFLYLYENEGYEKISDFVGGATSPEKEYTSYTDISQTEIEKGKVKLKITEELEETAYIDRIYLLKDGEEVIEISETNTNSDLLSKSDNKYLIMEKGDEHYLEFNVEDYETLEFAAEGYYLEKVEQENPHNSLYTDFVRLTIEEEDILPPDVIIQEPLQTYYTSSSVDLTIQATDALTDVENCRYTLNGGPQQPLTQSIYNNEIFYDTPTLSDNNYHIVFYCEDSEGNINNTESVDITVDTQGPTTTSSPSTPWGEWSNSSIQISLSCSDTLSGCSQTKYCITESILSCSPYSIYTIPFTVSAEGYRRVLYYSTDNAGNQGPTEENQTRIDLTPPTISKIVSPTSGGIYNTDFFTFRIEAYDPPYSLTTPLSGIEKCEYKLNSEPYVEMTPSSGEYTASSTLSDGTHSVEFRCTDNAGNTQGTASRSFTIDTVPPTSSVTSPSSGSWHNTDFSVSFSDDDPLSGLDYCQYRILNNEVQSLGWTTRICNSPRTIDISAYCSTDGANTCRVETRAVDNVGNTGTADYRTFSIDTTAPTVTIKGIGDDPTAPYSTSDTSPTVTVTTNENAECRASIDGDESYDGMSDDIDCSGDGSQSHTCNFGTLSETSSRNFYVSCMDNYGNENTAGNNAQANAEIDDSEPTQSSHNPQKGLTITTTSPTIGFNTNEDSRCRWSLSDQAYSSMSSGNTCDSSYST